MHTNYPPQICFTGFTKPEKYRLSAIATEAGMEVVQSVTKRLEFLCVGEAPGPSKVDKAKSQKVDIITADEFMNLLETGEVPDKEEPQPSIEKPAALIQNTEVPENKSRIRSGRQVGALLGIGIFLAPILFIWPALRNGYPTYAKVIAVIWLVLCTFIVGIESGANHIKKQIHSESSTNQ